ncbi:unnamed protein product [Callosobruchus maculatus]|uniref:EF-hand domain-containing protein n=1 Tax=Callosobruchus maculatus TaxID=64391 RepID=A0A653C3G7_CALMS|nr:unnamed protein product [Callosobruchus maculatus]
MADGDCASEAASSIGDEERVRRLFQACDANGDGYIDSQDLLSICKELCLEDSIDELMLQLGADSQGRISYDQFLQRRLALRPEIDALKNSSKDNTSENSQGKLDSWEWDSGARDMSPVPKNIKNSEKYTEEEFNEKLQQMLDEQAQRYEEQLTELHSVIAELTRKLQQQQIMAINEEDEVSETCTSAHEESITCPLEVSESDHLDNDVSSCDNKLSNSPPENPEQQYNTHIPNVVEPLRNEITSLKRQLQETQAKLSQVTLPAKVEDDISHDFGLADKNRLNYLQPRESLELKRFQENESNSKHIRDAVVTTSKQNIKNNAIFVTSPVSKIAERIKLRRAADVNSDISPSDLVNSDLPTMVAEQIVGDILGQCDLQSEKECLLMELKKMNAKLDHARAQNNVLSLTISDIKAQCDKLTLLCGKYESNAIALRLALGISDRTIQAYDVLLALLETELSLKDNKQDNLENRMAAETVAKQLLHNLDSFHETDLLFSVWQDQVCNTPLPDIDEPWTSDDELRLREHISRLKSERSSIQGTYVALESTQIEHVPVCLSSYQEARKMDLEMAVMMQELMGLREDKAELISKIYELEKDKGMAELKVKYLEDELKCQLVALKSLQRKPEPDKSLPFTTQEKGK